MFKIEYKKGDLFATPFEVDTLVPHIVNSIGAWGSGFVLAVDKFSERPRLWYKNWSNSTGNFMLGEIQPVLIPQKNVVVVNMLAQKGIGENEFGMPAIRYESLRECLYRVRKLAELSQCVIRSPKFGAGLAGGNWAEIELIITEVFWKSDVTFTVYTL